MTHRILIVGAGFSGAVLARELADSGAFEVVVIDARTHLGGNCHTERDGETGILIHRYGPHLFHTGSAEVWEYVNRFGGFRPFLHRVKATTSRGVFSLPINLHTLNQFFGRRMSPEEARHFLASLAGPPVAEPAHFEEAAVATLGRDLYETFIEGYTRKQWGCDPRELPAAVFRRLPIRFSYEDNYYADPYQGIPESGYTAVIEAMLRHPAIRVELGRALRPGEWPSGWKGFRHLFFTGPIDAFFGHRFGRLSYRTVTFERIDAEGDWQGCAVMNYPGREVPYTRIHEHKHFAPWETHRRTVAFREYSHETGPEDPHYYPKRLQSDLERLRRYREAAEAGPGVSFLGRLGTYRYLDMDRVIGEALEMSRRVIAAAAGGRPFPASSDPD